MNCRNSYSSRRRIRLRGPGNPGAEASFSDILQRIALVSLQNLEALQEMDAATQAIKEFGKVSPMCPH